MRVIVASQGAGVGGSIVGDGLRTVGRDDFNIKVYEALPGNHGADTAHSVRGVACGTTEAVVDVACVVSEAGVGDDLRQIMALPAKAIWPIDAEVRIREEIQNQLARQSSL